MVLILSSMPPKRRAFKFECRHETSYRSIVHGFVQDHLFYRTRLCTIFCCDRWKIVQNRARPKNYRERFLNAFDLWRIIILLFWKPYQVNNWQPNHWFNNFDCNPQYYGVLLCHLLFQLWHCYSRFNKAWNYIIYNLYIILFISFIYKSQRVITWQVSLYQKTCDLV